jgi:hypothetical protein
MALPNGLELSCPAPQATLHPFSRILAGKSRSNFPLASRVSCSELLGIIAIMFPRWGVLRGSTGTRGSFIGRHSGEDAWKVGIHRAYV